MAPPGAVPGDVVVGDVVEVGVVTVVVVELVVVVLLPSSVPHPVARGSTATPAIRPIQAECLRHDARDCGRMLVSAVNLMVMFASLSAVVAVFPEIETSNPQWLNWRRTPPSPYGRSPTLPCTTSAWSTADLTTTRYLTGVVRHQGSNEEQHLRGTSTG